MKKQVKEVRRRFLVASLSTAREPGNGAASFAEMQDSEAEVSNALIDSRMAFLQGCQQKHWQFNELRRAHYSTLMLLAHLGGPPKETAATSAISGTPLAPTAEHT